MKKALTFLTAVAFSSASENGFLADDEFLMKRPKDFTHVFADDELTVKHVKRVHFDATDDELLVKDPRDSLHIFKDNEQFAGFNLGQNWHYPLKPIGYNPVVNKPVKTTQSSSDDSLYRFGGNLVQNWHYPLKPIQPAGPNKPVESAAQVESGAENSLYRFGGNLVQNWHYPLRPIQGTGPYVVHVENKPVEQSVPVESSAEDLLNRFGGNLVQNWHYPLKPMNSYVAPVENKPKVEEETIENELFTLREMIRESGKKTQGKKLNNGNKGGILDDVKRERQNI